LARIRLESGSIWPAIIGHSAWNATIQGVFDFSTVPDPDSLWIGESGILVALATSGLAWLSVRGKWPMQRAPGVLLAPDTGSPGGSSGS
jgi:uncharacterized protein